MIDIRTERRPSCEQRTDNVAVHVGQAKIPALEFVREPGVIEAEQLKHCGMQVVDVNLVLGHVETEVVAFTQSDSRLHAATRQPHCESVGMMISAVVPALHHGSTAEF